MENSALTTNRPELEAYIKQLQAQFLSDDVRKIEYKPQHVPFLLVMSPPQKEEHM